MNDTQRQSAPDEKANVKGSPSAFRRLADHRCSMARSLIHVREQMVARLGGILYMPERILSPRRFGQESQRRREIQKNKIQLKEKTIISVELKNKQTGVSFARKKRKRKALRIHWVYHLDCKTTQSLK